MNRSFAPWSDVLFEDALRYQQVIWFALACLEREHRLNVAAATACWLGPPAAWWLTLGLLLQAEDTH